MTSMRGDKRGRHMPLGSDTDANPLDLLPGLWLMRHDPTFEAVMHNHAIFPTLSFMFIFGVFITSSYKYFGMLRRPDFRPLFVVSKKTWLNSKVPRKRARNYANYFWKKSDHSDKTDIGMGYEKSTANNKKTQNRF